MLIEEAIMRKSAEARKETASGLQADAMQYVDLDTKIDDLRIAKMNARDELHSMQNMHENLMRNMQTFVRPEIPGNRVTIYPTR